MFPQPHTKENQAQNQANHWHANDSQQRPFVDRSDSVTKLFTLDICAAGYLLRKPVDYGVYLLIVCLRVAMLHEVRQSTLYPHYLSFIVQNIASSYFVSRGRIYVR
jgi:hypothetical protein